jgi:hypothetical protein
VAEPIPLCATFWGCLHEFQTLIAGCLAVVAAAATAYVIWRAAHLPVLAQAGRDEEMTKRRVRYECLVLSSQLQILRRRASQAAATIRVYIAANKDVSDEAKERIYLSLPKIIEDWEVMSLLPVANLESVLDLSQTLNEHNFDIARTGGAFGDDNFRKNLLQRLDYIMTRTSKLVSDFAEIGA